MVEAVLDQKLGFYGEQLVVISGMAAGADAHAAEWARRNNVELAAFYADWAQYGRAAGPIRNRQMLTEGRPDEVVAFTLNLQKSKGTKDMVTVANDAGVPTTVLGSPLIVLERRGENNICHADSGNCWGCIGRCIHANEEEVSE